MLTADPLSRRPDHEKGVNFDNENEILLKPEFFAISAIENSHDLPINDDNILREVKEALSKPFKNLDLENLKNLWKNGTLEMDYCFIMENSIFQKQKTRS